MDHLAVVNTGIVVVYIPEHLKREVAMRDYELLDRLWYQFQQIQMLPILRTGWEQVVGGDVQVLHLCKDSSPWVSTQMFMCDGTYSDGLSDVTKRLGDGVFSYFWIWISPSVLAGNLAGLLRNEHEDKFIEFLWKLEDGRYCVKVETGKPE